MRISKIKESHSAIFGPAEPVKEQARLFWKEGSQLMAFSSDHGLMIKANAAMQ